MSTAGVSASHAVWAANKLGAAGGVYGEFNSLEGNVKPPLRILG